MLRVLPSVMVHPLMSAYQVNATAIGIVSAFYFYTYTPLQLPAGMIADKYSPRLVLTISCLICSIGTILFATTHHFYIACLARGMMGVGSAFAFVGALKLASIWLPENRFAFFAGLTTSVGILGAVAVDNILTTMVYDLGWQHTVYLLGLWGLGLTVLLYVFIRKKPKPETRSYKPKPDKSWRATFKRFFGLAKNPYIWMNGIIGLVMFLPITAFASLWGVDFLNRAYDLKSAEAASAVSLVFIGMAVVSPFTGLISDKLNSRKIPLFIGCMGCFVSGAVLFYVTHLPFYLLYMMLFLFGAFASPQVLTFAMSKDLSSKFSTGMSTALTNFIITIGAGIYQPMIGYALDSQWNGAKTEYNTPMFSMHDYQFALSFVLYSFLVASVFVLLLPNKKRLSKGRQ